MRSWTAALIVATFALGMSACSNREGVVSPAAPSAPAAPASVTIEVAEINGPYSFFPSPTTVRGDQTIVWRNIDTVAHHLVLDDGSVDAGTIAPGTVSQPERIGTGSRTYHCTIHPTMVGTVIVTAAPPGAMTSDAAAE